MTAFPESRVFNVLAASICKRGDGLDLLARTEAGPVTLHFSSALADGLLITPHIDFTAVRGKLGARSSGRLDLRDVKRAAYVRAFIAWRTAPIATQREVCAAHGIGYHAFTAWVREHRAEVEAAYAAHLAGQKSPLTKPSGKIL